MDEYETNGLRQYWTEEEKQFLKDNYYKYDTKYCVELLEKNRKACTLRAERLEVTNTNYWTIEEILWLNSKRRIL